MSLFKPSNGTMSQPVDFYFYPARKHIQAIRIKDIGLTQNGLILKPNNPLLTNLIQKSPGSSLPQVL